MPIIEIHIYAIVCACDIENREKKTNPHNIHANGYEHTAYGANGSFFVPPLVARCSQLTIVIVIAQWRVHVRSMCS